MIACRRQSKCSTVILPIFKDFSVSFKVSRDSSSMYASSKVLSSSCNRFAVDVPVSWSEVSLKSFRSSCGTGVFSLGSRGSGNSYK